MKFPAKWQAWIYALGTIVLLSLLVGAFLFYRAVLEVPRDAYAMWAAGELVCEHLRRNNDDWPANWAQLADTYEAIRESGIQTKTETNTIGGANVVSIDVLLPASFRDISNRVRIDWSADIQKLRNANVTNGIPFKVLTLKNGRIRSYEEREPNRTE